MKKKLSLIASTILFFISSLVISQSTSIKLESLYKNIFSDKYEIVENGVKLQYYTKNNLKKEINKIVNILSINNYDEKIYKNSIYLNGKKDNIEFWIKGSLSHEKNFIEVEVIEESNRININNLQSKLYKIKDNSIENEQYFTFAKGKLIKNSDEQNRLSELFKNKKPNEFQTISINSGITSTVRLKNKLHINYSLSNYDDGTYLIVGTPIIFVEY